MVTQQQSHFCNFIQQDQDEEPGCILLCCKEPADCSFLLTAGYGYIRCASQNLHRDSYCPSGSGCNLHGCSLRVKEFFSGHNSSCFLPPIHNKSSTVVVTGAVLDVLFTSVSTPSISASVLVATAGVIAVVVPLVATTTATSEPTLPVVKAFIRRWASLAALLVVLLQQIFGLFAFQLDEGHGLQEVTGFGDSEVGFRRDRGNRVEQRYTHPAIIGWKERKRGVGV